MRASASPLALVAAHRLAAQAPEPPARRQGAAQSGCRRRRSARTPRSSSRTGCSRRSIPTGRSDWPAGAEVLDFPQGDGDRGPRARAAGGRPRAGEDPAEAITPERDRRRRPRSVRAAARSSCAAGSPSRASRRAPSGSSRARDRRCASARRSSSSCSSARGSLRVNIGEGPRRTPDIFKPPVLPGRTIRCRPRSRRRRRPAPARSRSCARCSSARRRRGQPGLDAGRGGRRSAAVRPRAERRAAAPRRGGPRTPTSPARSSSPASSRSSLVIEGGNEAWKLAKELKAIDAAVILRVASLPPVGRAPQAPIFRAAGEGSPEAAAALKAAGVAGRARPADGRRGAEPRYHAARALGPGFGWSDVLARDHAQRREDPRRRRRRRDARDRPPRRLRRVARRSVRDRGAARARDGGRPRRASREAPRRPRRDHREARPHVRRRRDRRRDRARRAGQDPRGRSADHDPVRRPPHRRPRRRDRARASSTAAGQVGIRGYQVTGEDAIELDGPRRRRSGWSSRSRSRSTPTCRRSPRRRARA